jgi:two-component system, chemotaxis family, protein-glutamate methylesterase/glutaminase
MSIQRMLICEDSRVYAAALRRVLEYDGDIEVAAVCASAEEAIAALPRIRPDLVTMDLELPGMDGLTAVEQIMNSGPVPILVLSALVGAGSATAAAAMAAGALDAMAKGDLDLMDPASAASVAFRRRVRVLSRARVIRHLGALLKARPHAAGPTHQASVIGICSSTGGPQVLGRLLEALPAGYPIPLLIVQHISVGFTEGLAHWLGETVPLPVGIATDGAPLKPGIWIAPDGAHLKLTVSGHLALDRQTVTGHHRPSADVLLASIAEAAGAAGVAVVLTGMGSDGALGAAAVRRAGGLAIAQDEASSAVYGMPRAAIESGTDIVLPPNGIAARLLGLNHRPLRSAR